MQAWFVAIVAVAYVTLLFGIASHGDRRAAGRASGLTRPNIYALSLGIYCTSWTFFGSVGLAAERGPFPFDGPDGLFPPRGGRGFRRGGKDRGRGTGSRPWEGDDADGYGPRGDEAPGWGPRGRGQAGPRHHGHRGGPRGPLDGWPEPEGGDEARRFRRRRRGCGRPGSEDCGPRW